MYSCAVLSASGINSEQACHCRPRPVVNPFSITKRSVTPSTAKPAHRQNSLDSSINHLKLPCKLHRTRFFRAFPEALAIPPPLRPVLRLFLRFACHSLFPYQTATLAHTAYTCLSHLCTPPLQPTSTRPSHRIASQLNSATSPPSTTDTFKLATTPLTRHTDLCRIRSLNLRPSLFSGDSTRPPPTSSTRPSIYPTTRRHLLHLLRVAFHGLSLSSIVPVPIAFALF